MMQRFGHHGVSLLEIRSLNIAWQAPQRHRVWHTVLPLLQQAPEIVGHIDVCLVRVARCILPLTSWMGFDLTQKETPRDDLHI